MANLNKNIKEAIILAGGKGTRLQSVVSNVPKPMALIGDKPFLMLLLQYLQLQGIEKVVLSVGYMYEIIQETFGESFNGLSISYSIESEPLGTGGAIAKAMTMVESQSVLVLNGDSFIKINLEEIERKIPT